ncbi:MAG: hypothetical protein R3F48_07825 [Candidatus Zixiibacteriota bacterium]
MSSGMSKKSKADVRNALFRQFEMHENVAAEIGKYKDNFSRFDKARQVLFSDLQAIVSTSRSEHPMELFAERRFDARVKSEFSLTVKLFNKMWHNCGYDDQGAWPQTPTPPYFDKLIEPVELKKAYEDIKDMVGGRVVVCCADYMEMAIERVKVKLKNLGYYIYKNMDKDFIRKPKRTYYGYHIFVKVPIGAADKKNGKRGRPEVIAELQIQTLLGNAWAVFEHDTYYKKALTPGNQLVPEDVTRDVELINAGLIVNDGLLGVMIKRLND